jgi:Tol biopolymer transport system component
MRRQLSTWGVTGVVALLALVVSTLVPAGSSQGAVAPPQAAPTTSTTTSTTTTASAPRDGRIVVANLDTGRLETMNPDGSAVLPVTPANENGFQPAWAPDGSRIAFASDHAGPDVRIFSVRADGSGMQQVGDDPEGYVDNTPTYTPDGQHIVFTRCRPDPPGGCALYSMRTNGQGKHAVTAYDGGDRADFYPDVAPDGRIAFTRFGDRGILAQVWVAQADGSRAHAVTTPQLEAGAPQWTRDGHHLLVTSAFSHFGDNIYSLRDDGKQMTKLTSARFPNNSVFAAPSPSGLRIVYSDDQAYPQVIGADLLLMNPDGSHKKAITSNGRLLDPDWGTAPLVKASAAQSRLGTTESATPPRHLTLPRWLATKVGPTAPTTRWSH